VGANSVCRVFWLGQCSQLPVQTCAKKYTTVIKVFSYCHSPVRRCLDTADCGHSRAF
jgi:hypothetical protein